MLLQALEREAMRVSSSEAEADQNEQSKKFLEIMLWLKENENNQSICDMVLYSDNVLALLQQRGMSVGTKEYQTVFDSMCSMFLSFTKYIQDGRPEPEDKPKPKLKLVPTEEDPNDPKAS